MLTTLRTACTRDCPDACQIVATVSFGGTSPQTPQARGDEGRITALKGDPAHPVTRGFLCYRTDHFLDRQYDPDRLTTPLMRRGGKGSPLVRASWDEALDKVAGALRDAMRDLGPASILHYQSGGSLGLLKLVNRHFFELLGPVTHKRGDICSGAGDAAQLEDFGREDAHDLADLAHAQTIVLWGKNVGETGVHLIPHLKEARKRGAKVIVIDPMVNPKTTALCDRHYSVRPGADGFLALGVARVIVDEGWAHPDAASWCDGYDAFVALARRYSARGWAARADVSEEDVRAIAALYGKNKPAALFVGWGLGRRSNGSATIRLLDALGAITGNLGVPGGGVSYYFQRRGGFDTSFIKRPENRGARTLLEACLGEELLRADPKVMVAVVDNGNPVSQLPDSTTVAKGLSSVPCLVVIDSFLTDTAELADVVLPSTTMLEEHDVVGAYGHSYVQLARPVAPPLGEAKCDLEIYQALADRLGFGEAMRGSPEAWIDRFLAPMAEKGVTREALAKGGLRKPDAPMVLFEGRVFPTPSGRVQLITDFPAEPPQTEEGYPLFLMSNSWYRSQSSQISARAQEGVPEVWASSAAAGQRPDGSLAKLVSPLGEVVVRIRIDDRQRRDTVLYPKGRWGKFGGPNVLIRAKETDAGEGAAYLDQGVRFEDV